MTVAVACNLSDGVILGVDSAVSVPVPGGVGKVYEHAEKLFQLGEQPIGVATYGLGVLGNRSIGSYLREFEVRDPHSVVSKPGKVADLVEAMRAFFMSYYGEHIPVTDQGAVLGLVVAGYSFGDYLSEVWHIQIPQHGEPGGAELSREQGNFGLHWWGAYGPIQRYALGYDDNLKEDHKSYFQELLGRGFTPEESHELDDIFARYGYEIYSGAMPMREGIEYIRWLVELVVNHYRFIEEQPMIVGGAVNVGLVTYTEEKFRILGPTV